MPKRFKYAQGRDVKEATADMSQLDLMSMREHLGELKRRLKVVFASYVVLLLIFIAVPANPATVFSNNGNYVTFVSFFILRIRADILPSSWVLIANGVSEPLEVFLVASLIFAFVFNLPISAYELFRYIDPALKPEERRAVYPFVTASSVLFAIGCLFGYYFLAKALVTALTPFFVETSASPYLDLASFYFVVFLIILMSGVSFTIPAFIFVLLRFGVVDVTFFKKNRLIIWFVAYIFCAVVTPDGGPLLDLALFIPVIIMIEGAVFLGSMFRRNKPQPTGESQTGGGSGTAQVLLCKYCSAPLSPDSAFCPNCGKSRS